METIIKINDEDDYFRAVGRVLYFSQCIEHDLKLTYYLLNPNIDFNNIKKLTLGTTVKKLKEKDSSSKHPFLGTEDYDLLDQITKIRNRYAHECFIEWVYESKDRNKAFTKSANRLVNDHNRLAKLYRVIEKVRIDLAKKQDVESIYLKS